MIELILRLYLLLFPHCELMVSFLHNADFTHCNDSPAHAEHCYANSRWDYGGAVNRATLLDDWETMHFVFKLPFVRTVSCWR